MPDKKVTKPKKVKEEKKIILDSDEPIIELDIPLDPDVDFTEEIPEKAPKAEKAPKKEKKVKAPKGEKKSKKSQSAPKVKRTYTIIGHRGNSGYFPENTKIAIESCKTLPGVHAAEFDVQMTRDGEFILFHDEDLTRYNGEKNKLITCSKADLMKLDAGVIFGKKFKKTPIATLDDVMSILSEDEPFYFNIELKVSPAMKGEMLKMFVQRLYMQVDSWIDPQKMLFTSFNWDCLDLLKHLNQDIRLGVLTDQPDERGWISKVKQLSAEYIVFPMSKTDHELMSLVRSELETKIMVYSEFDFNQKAEELAAVEKLIQQPVDALIVNYPQEAAAILNP